jgi:pyridoxine 4-dehydrogenase
VRLTGPGIFGPPADLGEAVRVLRRAVDLGVRVIDTAWYSGPDVAEEIVAEARHPYPDDLVLITKLRGARGPDASWYPALSAAELREGCERDLRLLRIETVPVVHLRWMDGAEADFLDALGALVALRDEGKVARIGLSNVDADQVCAACKHVEIATVSNAYSVLERDNDDLVELCAREGIAFLHAPLTLPTPSPRQAAGDDRGHARLGPAAPTAGERCRRTSAFRS